ncbi:hypothetical protein DSTSK_35850 [Desulforhabdus sp. TSK]|nr:hypothetical protein DSTSK_35850 [Desulforhabdus sp. TSK]
MLDNLSPLGRLGGLSALTAAKGLGGYQDTIFRHSGMF